MPNSELDCAFHLQCLAIPRQGASRGPVAQQCCVSHPLALPRDFAGLWVHGFPVTCLGAALLSASGSEQVIATGQGFTLGESVAVLRRIYGASARYVPAPAGGGMAPSAGYVVAGRGGNDLAFIVNPMGTRVDTIVAGRGVDPSSCPG
jgi:hypothetical protein